MTIGAVAKRTGLTVRTLHHYDEIGLVRPSGRSASGYRVYGEAALRRIEKVLVLRPLGLSLEEVGKVLDDPAWTRARILRARLDALDREIEERTAARGRLAALVAAEEGAGSGRADVDAVIGVVRELDDVRQWYTEEQLEVMGERAASTPREEIERVQNRWPALIAEVAELARRQTPPSDARVRELAREWRSLIEAFTGGDDAVETNLSRMYESRPEMASAMGITPEVTALIQGALRGESLSSD